MSERAELVGLLRAARQRPEDDTPRLVVADWLEEYGDEADRARAELIRLQVQLGLPPNTGGRPRALIAAHREVWLGPFAALGDAVHFEHGMLALDVPASKLVGRAGARLARGEAVCWLEKVTLQQANDAAVVGFLSSPLLPRIGHLVIANAGLGIKAARALMHSEDVSGLVTLDLNNNRLSNLGASAIVGSPDLAGVRSLDLSHNRIGFGGARAIAETCHMLRLRHLDLGGNGIAADGLAALVGSRVMENVESFDIRDNDLRPAGAERLALAHAVRALRALNLARNSIGDRGASALARSPHLASLETLNLRSNQITDAGARALLESPCLPRLAALDLAGNRLSEAMRRAVNARFPGGDPIF